MTKLLKFKRYIWYHLNTSMPSPKKQMLNPAEITNRNRNNRWQHFSDPWENATFLLLSIFLFITQRRYICCGAGKLPHILSLKDFSPSSIWKWCPPACLLERSFALESRNKVWWNESHMSNLKTGLRLKEIMPKESVPRNRKSNVKIIAWHSGTAQSMIIAWIDVFKSGLCLKFVPTARPWNLMVKQWECVAPQEKLNFLNWLHPQSHWRLCLLELRQNLSVFIKNQKIWLMFPNDVVWCPNRKSRSIYAYFQSKRANVS